MTDNPLLAVHDLVVSFATEAGTVTAVDGVSFDIPARAVVALVGESGSGKTVTALSIMRLLPAEAAEVQGRVLLEGRDLLALSERQMRKLRGAELAMIFQDPVASLNPVYSVGSQVVEALRLHRRLSRRAARDEAIAILHRVGLPEPAERFGDYPHELSGGMCQRVMIAIAIACRPHLLIADEPTTALDMLAAAQVLAIMSDLERDHDLSLLLISHDLGVVAELADEVLVLYAGQVVERGRMHEVVTAPRHPYTRALVDSVPPARPRGRRRRPTPTRLPALAPRPPDDTAWPTGCRFSDRCPHVWDRCRQEAPPLFDVGLGAQARCFLHDPADPHGSATAAGGAP